jgi:uncharacterized phage protein gp47/JayE
MAFEVPSFIQIRDRILADIDAKLEADGFERGPVEYALACGMAGASLLLHAAIAAVGRNIVPTTAEDAVMFLWASFFGIVRRAATRNIGSATFTATAGTSIPEGAALRTRDGTEFTVDAEAEESGGTITVAFTATNTGRAGRSDGGVPIFLGSPIAGVQSQGVVTVDGIAGGADIESPSSVLGRLLDRLRNPPKGGTEADYRAWARATEGVEVDGVWVRPNTLGPSSIRVLFTLLDELDPIPSGVEEGLVTAEIQSRAPADLLTVAAYGPTAQPLDPVISVTPDTTEVRAAVTASLRTMLRELEPGDTALLSRIREAVSAAPGETDSEVTSPSANVAALSPYHLITLGTLTFV